MWSRSAKVQPASTPVHALHALGDSDSEDIQPSAAESLDTVDTSDESEQEHDDRIGRIVEMRRDAVAILKAPKYNCPKLVVTTLQISDTRRGTLFWVKRQPRAPRAETRTPETAAPTARLMRVAPASALHPPRARLHPLRRRSRH